MAPVLQIVIAVVLVVLCAALVPLLIQLRATAQAVQHLADSARVDLSDMAKDLHHLRNRTDELADLAAASMALPATLGELMTSLGRSLPTMFGQQTSGWVGMLMSGLQLVIESFQRRKKTSPEGER